MSRKLRARCQLHSFLSVSDATVASVDKTEMTLLFVNRYLEPFFFQLFDIFRRADFCFKSHQFKRCF